MIIPVILAGGSGSRLWPLSRSAYPKQLLPLVSDKTMLQETVLRAQSVSIAKPLIICNQEHRFIVVEQLNEIGINDAFIILEPIGKNTAPAIAIAAFFLDKYYEKDSILMIMPADHIFEDLQYFKEKVNLAEISARAGKLVTFGIKPTHAETGYGYIKTSLKLNDDQSYQVLEFVEKPDLATVKKYIDSNQYYWNSGMFMSKTSSLLQELIQYAPDVFSICKKTVNEITEDLNFFRMDKKVFAACPSISIDYAIMEKTQNAVLIPLHTKWSDIGSWLALCEMLPSDINGNVIHGDVITDQVSHSYLRSENRMLAAVGVENHIIIETSDAVLVVHKDHCQSVKSIVNQLKEQRRSETELHKRVYRPWGFYETIDKGDCFQVKRITVNPKASLSLQMHRYRSEHWVVVKGVAEVTRDDEIFTITSNQSTYIPKGVKHRLSNPGQNNLEIIEVQSGNYLEEDDIVRFDDVYGRAETAEMSPA